MGTTGIAPNGGIDPSKMLEAMENLAMANAPSQDEMQAVTQNMSIDLGAILREALNVKQPEPGEFVDDPSLQFDVPIIDTPNVKITVKIDLARMSAILNIEAEGEQAKTLQEIIESEKGNIVARTKERMENVEKTLKDMDKAAHASIFQKIFGWIAVAIAIAVAAVMSVASGGLALGPAVGALIGLTFQLMNTIKVDGKTLTQNIIEKMADSIQKTFGCDRAAAELAANIIWMVTELAVSLLGGIGADKLATKIGGANKFIKPFSVAWKALEKVENAQRTIKWVGLLTGLTGVGSATWSGITARNCSKDEAESEFIKAFLQQLKKVMEDTEDFAEVLLKIILGNTGRLEAQLEEALSCSEDIVRNIGMING